MGSGWATFSCREVGKATRLEQELNMQEQRLDTGHWTLGTGHWTLGTGHWTLDTDLESFSMFPAMSCLLLHVI